MTHQADDQEKLLLDEGDLQVDVGHHREGNRKTEKTERHKYRQKDIETNIQTNNDSPS